jgi:hypothetical protein
MGSRPAKPTEVRASPLVSEYVYDEPKAAYVLYCLLRRTPHNQRRKLMRELDVVVRVSHPRSPAERAKYGKTPAAERITVEVGNLVILGRAAAAEENGCLEVKNISRFVAPARTTRRNAFADEPVSEIDGPEFHMLALYLKWRIYETVLARFCAR